MAVFLITYDLNKETDRPKILEDIKAFGTWAMLSESSYAVVSGKSADDIYDDFRKHLDDNDNFYVISLRKPISGQGSEEVNEWLQTHIPW